MIGYPLIAQGIFNGGLFWILALIALWEIPWKGVAMWKAAKRGHLIWFLVFLIVNLAGIPEILYIFIFADRKKTKKKH